MILITKKSGFSLAGLIMIMLAVSIALLAAIPLLTTKSDIKTNTSTYVKDCIVTDSANVSTTNCTGAIAGIKNLLSKDFETTLYYLNNTSYTSEALTLIKTACDSGAERACKILIEKCIDNSSNCDITGNNDIKYYLNLLADGSDAGTASSGRDYIEEISSYYYAKGNSNFDSAVDNTCTSNFNSTACSICCENSTINYEFNVGDEALFTQSDDTVSNFENSKVNIELSSGGSGTVWQSSVYLTTTSGTNVHFEPKDMVVDTSGYVYIWGHRRDPGSAIFAKDLWLMKLDTNGDLVWYRGYTGGSNPLAFGINTNSSGEVFITGRFNGDGGVAEIDPSNGDILWSNIYGDISACHMISADSNYVYFVGDGYGDNDSPIFKVSKDGTTSVDGTNTWKKKFQLSGYSVFQGVTHDSSGNVYMTGWIDEMSGYSSGNSFRVFKITSNGSNSQSNGSTSWRKTLDASGDEFGDTIAVDESTGHIYVVGGTEDYGDPTIIVKLDSDGSVIWQQQIAGMGVGTDEQYEHSNHNGKYFDGKTLVIDSNKNLYIVGTLMSSTGYTFGGDDIIVMKINDLHTSGTAPSPPAQIEWQKRVGTTDDDFGRAIALFNDELYVLGQQYGDPTSNNASLLFKLSTTQTSNMPTELVLSNLSLSDPGDNLNIGDNNLYYSSYSLPYDTAYELNGKETDTDIISGLNSSTGSSAYISTKTESQLTNTYKINSISIDQYDPDGENAYDTDILWMISFDGGTTWKYYNGTSWVSSDLSSFATGATPVGMRKSVLEAQLANMNTEAANTFDIAFMLYANSSATESPYVNNITINGLFKN